MKIPTRLSVDGFMLIFLKFLCKYYLVPTQTCVLHYSQAIAANTSGLKKNACRDNDRLRLRGAIFKGLWYKNGRVPSYLKLSPQSKIYSLLQSQLSSQQYRRRRRIRRIASIGQRHPSIDNTTKFRPELLLCLLKDVDGFYGIFGAVQADEDDEPCSAHRCRESSDVNSLFGELVR